MTAQADATTSNAVQATLERLAGLSHRRRVWLRVGQVIDGVLDKPLRNANVVFDALQIYEVTPENVSPTAEGLAPGQCEPDAELPNFTLLPCLIEAHAHLFLQGGSVDVEDRKSYLKLPPDELLANARTRWPAILQCGVGTVRDAGDKDGVGLALAAAAKTKCGQLSATPWIDSPGAAIHHRGRYGSFMGRPLEDHATLADCVGDRIRAGADRIKLLVSGIIDFRAGDVIVPPQMSTDEVAAICRAATENGRQTFAHASGTAGVENAIAGGVTTVEHGFFITTDHLARMRDDNIAWVPTFSPVEAQVENADGIGWDAKTVANLHRILETHRNMLFKAHAMGVSIVAGSDAGSFGVPHGLGLLRELCSMEQAGISALAVLKSATGISSSVLKFAELVGRIAAGFRSRFIVTAHDPLATVANLHRDKSIVFDGALISGEPDVEAARL